MPICLDRNVLRGRGARRCHRISWRYGNRLCRERSCDTHLLSLGARHVPFDCLCDFASFASLRECFFNKREISRKDAKEAKSQSCEMLPGKCAKPRSQWKLS